MRIIAGRWRGTRLPIVTAPGLRPTADRIRETLFNWLLGECEQSRCLDLFAGSGALGFEALSRGASHCDLVELQPAAAAQLRANQQQLAAEATIFCCSAEQFLANPPAPTAAGGYQLVFLDPPFADQLLPTIAEQLERSTLLAAQCWLYVELAAEQLFAAPPSWSLHRQRNSGGVSYRLYRRVADRATIA